MREISPFTLDWHPAAGCKRPAAQSGRGLRMRQGFTLIEVSLALVVVAVGMFSVLSLFPTGLDQNMRSIGDTEASLFSAEVLGGLRVQADADWAQIGQPIPIAAAIGTSPDGRWDNPAGLRIEGTGTSIYANVYLRVENTNLTDHVLRYQLILTTNGLIKTATLKVWPSAYGSTKDSMIFYTEFCRAR